jgi:hypothetical protein
MPPLTSKNLLIGLAMLAAVAWYLQSRTSNNGASKPLFNWALGGL